MPGRSPEEISFYVPSAELVRSVPSSIDDYWPWITALARVSPVELPDGRGRCTWLGPYDWTVQTFVRLRHEGVRCELTATLPDRGVIVAHGDFLPAALRPTARQFIVEIKPDRLLQCPFANFAIVQNRHDPMRRGLAGLLVPSALIAFWPQPGLIPRDAGRGDRFENIGYLGSPGQFLERADILEREVAKLGLRWRIATPDRWHDYSEIDAVVAVRPLDTTAARQKATAHFLDPSRKPASKLINGWRAGVPVIHSPEVACRELRRSDLDYVEARTIPDVVAQLTRLQADVHLRRAMAENARRRGAEFDPCVNSRAWMAALQREIIPRYRAWSASPLRRRWWYWSRPMLRRQTQAT
jgi:hypothetical protein